jgi:chemotaxis protein histidine kinase CheA
MDDLTRLYCRTLAAHADELEGVDAPEHALTEESVRSIRRVAHLLRGSGGTFGFADITRAAAAVEDADDVELAGAVRQLVSVLRNVIERAEA